MINISSFDYPSTIRPQTGASSLDTAVFSSSFKFSYAGGWFPTTTIYHLPFTLPPSFPTTSSLVGRWSRCCLLVGDLSSPPRRSSRATETGRMDERRSYEFTLLSNLIEK